MNHKSEGKVLAVKDNVIYLNKIPHVVNYDRRIFNVAIDEFRDKYYEIVSDQFLNQLAIDIDIELINQGDRRDYPNRYTSIGESIRKWLEHNSPPSSNEFSGYRHLVIQLSNESSKFNI